MRLLLVEDDLALRNNLKTDLERAGFAVDGVDNGVDGQYLGESEPYDVAVLDLGLPDRPGLEVLRHWRSHGSPLPVIILTARDAWHERVEGFKAGADDYVGKPFHVEELLARLQAVMRRAHQRPNTPLTVNGLTLNEETQAVTDPQGRVCRLTGVEFRLLRYLMLHPGKVLSKSVLAEHVYDYDSEKDSNVLEVYINRLRRKLGQDCIRTRRGQGYIFGTDE